MKWTTGQDFARDRIGWLGSSMGTSTLVMEAAQNPNNRVAVAVLDGADSRFQSPRASARNPAKWITSSSRLNSAARRLANENGRIGQRARIRP